MLVREVYVPKGPLPLDIPTKIEKFEESCSKRIQQLKLENCVERIFGYSKQFSGKVGGMFSTHMTDEQYQTFLNNTAPGLMELPPELKNADHALPDNWKEIAKEKGWKWALFPSNLYQQRLVILLPDQLEKGRGTEFRRMIVYFRDSFSGAKDLCDMRKPAGVQMQAVEQKPATDGSLQDYFFQSWEFGQNDKRPHVKAAGGRCVTCHAGGPRAIEPFVDSILFKSECKIEVGGVANIGEFNKLIVTKGKLDFGPYYDMRNFPEHIKVGGPECIKCHNGNDRQSLAFAIQEFGRPYYRLIENKVANEKSMPPYEGHDLSDEKRTELVEFVVADHSKKLAEWMTEKKCAEPSKVSAPVTPPPDTAGAHR